MTRADAIPRRSIRPPHLDVAQASDDAHPGVPPRGRPGVLARRAAGVELLRSVLPWTALLLVCLCWDRAVYLHARIADPIRAVAMKDAGWYMVLRSLGELYAWGAVAVIFLLVDMGAPGNVSRMRNPFRRATFVFLCPLLSGGVAELLKPLVGRFKPENTDGWFVFANWRERFTEWSDMGVASSHTAVAFGAAFALSWVIPRGAPLFLAGAVGCATTRLLAGGHFLSDVYLGIIVAYLVSRAIRALDLRNNAGVPLAPR